MPLRETRDLMIAIVPKPYYEPGPPQDVLDSMLEHWITFQAHLYTLRQYEGRMVAPIITFQEITWKIITDPKDAGEYVVDHECEGCMAGKNKAEIYLQNNPEERLTFVSISYLEDWPQGTHEVTPNELLVEEV